MTGSPRRPARRSCRCGSVRAGTCSCAARGSRLRGASAVAARRRSAPRGRPGRRGRGARPAGREPVLVGVDPAGDAARRARSCEVWRQCNSIAKRPRPTTRLDLSRDALGTAVRLAPNARQRIAPATGSARPPTATAGHAPPGRWKPASAPRRGCRRRPGCGAPPPPPARARRRSRRVDRDVGARREAVAVAAAGVVARPPRNWTESAMISIAWRFLPSLSSHSRHSGGRRWRPGGPWRGSGRSSRPARPRR